MRINLIKDFAQLGANALCVALISSFGALGASAETGVSGRVSDPQGQVVVGATVRLSRKSTFAGETKTDAQGHYLLQEVAPGDYILTAPFYNALARIAGAPSGAGDLGLSRQRLDHAIIYRW